ncbi:hypothetical protein LCL97_04750 [Seohaeicola saemankumensis]|nr:hypothetical protein [Seohaeicola saemankumensis]MCA0870119.1 hypothetical protein [Seohaeicola saemankumensis]
MGSSSRPDRAPRKPWRGKRWPEGGVLVGYAAREGTLALLLHIEEPGLEIGKLFRKVRDTLYQITGRQQEPYTYGSLPGVDIYLKPPEVQQAAANDTGTVAPDGIVATCLRADQAGTIGCWNAILKDFAEAAARPAG